MNSVFSDVGEYDAWLFEVDGIGLLDGVDGFDGEGVDSSVVSKLVALARNCTVLTSFSSSSLAVASCFSREVISSLFCCR